jgi:hypothetical protein
VQNGTPTPENPVEIENAVVSTVSSVGENLVDIKEKTLSGPGSICSEKAVNIPAGTYTLSCEHDMQSNVWFATFYNASGETIYNTGYVEYMNKRVTFTLNQYATSVTIYMNTAGTMKDIMLNVGATALPYEPYKGGTATLAQPVNLPGIPVSSEGNYTDANGQHWICDEMDFARGVYVQRVGKVDLGTLSWTRNAGIHFYSSGIPATAVNFSENVMCTAYKVSPKGAYDSDIDKLVSVSSDRVWITDSSVDDDTSLKASLQGTMLYYELETPLETPISETDLTAYRTLHTNKPNTTVYTDSNAGMTVAYAADTKTYIDNKFAELAAAVLQNA